MYDLHINKKRCFSLLWYISRFYYNELLRSSTYLCVASPNLKLCNSYDRLTCFLHQETCNNKSAQQTNPDASTDPNLLLKNPRDARIFIVYLINADKKRKYNRLGRFLWPWHLFF